MSRLERTDPDYAKYYGDLGAWRNTLEPELRGELPTVSTVTIHHEELPHEFTADFACMVKHVRGFHGRGFMPVVKESYRGSLAANGDVFYGTTYEVMGKSKDEAVAMMNKEQAKQDDRRKELMRY